MKILPLVTSSDLSDDLIKNDIGNSERYCSELSAASYRVFLACLGNLVWPKGPPPTMAKLVERPTRALAKQNIHSFVFR